MKKIVIFTAISLFVATSAFAGASNTLSLASGSTGLTLYGSKTTGGAGPTSALIAKTSTGVGLGIIVDGTSGAGYAVKTQHKNGTKAFGSAYDTTSIFFKDVTAGTADNTSLTTSVGSFSAWSTL